MYHAKKWMVLSNVGVCRQYGWRHRTLELKVKLNLELRVSELKKREQINFNWMNEGINEIDEIELFVGMKWKAKRKLGNQNQVEKRQVQQLFCFALHLFVC